MSSDQPDEISLQPRTLSRGSASAAIALLAAALVAALVVAVYYHNQATSLQHQLSGAESRLSSAAASGPVVSAASELPVTDTRVVLVGPDALAAEITFASASSAARQDYLTVTATITGGRPDTRYTLVWGSCASTVAQQSATGVTDASGRADLTGRVSKAALEGTYQLQLIPGNHNLQSLAIYGTWSQPVPGQPQTTQVSGEC